MTPGDFTDYFGDGLTQPQVLHQNRAYRGAYRYPHHNQIVYAAGVAGMVSVSGVSLTKLRLHDWHPDAATAFTLAPCVSVIVGTVVERIGIVKSCESGCCFVQAQPPLQGTYEMIPSTCIVATNWPVATWAIDLTENRGLNTGVVSVHVAKHRR